MSNRTLELIIAPNKPHFVGDGFRVHNFIPSIAGLNMERMNPIIMLDYNAKYHFEPTEHPRGVGVHPHRGFETVTIVYKGKVAHHDSHGGGGVIGEGDVQWMTAASGVLHKEYHEKEWSAKGGDFHVVQLWVNLPAKYKMNPPKYQSISNANIHRFLIEPNLGEIEVISGKYNDIVGTAETFSPIHLFNAKLKQSAKASFNFPINFTTALLVIEGRIRVNNTEIAPDHFVLMANDGENFDIHALEDAIVLVLSGEPFDEPIASYGPFVMNTKQELVQAVEDFNQGAFGFLEE